MPAYPVPDIFSAGHSQSGMEIDLAREDGLEACVAVVEGMGVDLRAWRWGEGVWLVRGLARRGEGGGEGEQKEEFGRALHGFSRIRAMGVRWRTR